MAKANSTPVSNNLLKPQGALASATLTANQKLVSAINAMTEPAKEPAVMIDEGRRMVALEATWEISAISILISAALDDTEEQWAVKEVMKRLAYLNNLIMDAIGESDDTAEELRARSGFRS